MQNFFKDKKGDVVLWQRPNALLLLWAACAALSRGLPSSTLRQGIEYLGFGALVAWALLEIFGGTTYFRRVLGAVVLVFSIYSKLR